EAENGHAAGVRDATAVLAEANRCGMPHGRPIYFAVDEDTTVGPHVTAYFQGAASVLGLARTGAYGYKVIKGLFDVGLIAWGWQTYAWSSGHCGRPRATPAVLQRPHDQRPRRGLRPGHPHGLRAMAH